MGEPGQLEIDEAQGDLRRTDGDAQRQRPLNRAE